MSKNNKPRVQSFNSSLMAVALSLGIAGTAHAATAFDMQLSLTGFTAAQESSFYAAESTWESLITSYMDPGVPSGFQLQINGTAAAIDGAGGVLGSAGPTFIGSAGGGWAYAVQGSMSFDAADLFAMSDEKFAQVILHEMAHVIGIGTLWNTDHLIPGTQHLYDGNGQYNGAIGLSAFQQEFVGQSSAAFVPVELGGGAGTAGGHWDEIDGGGGPTGIERVADDLDMRDMLMTGWLNPNSFISDTTLGSFGDLGYNTTFFSAGVPVPEINGSQLGIGLTLLLSLVLLYRERESFQV